MSVPQPGVEPAPDPPREGIELRLGAGHRRLVRAVAVHVAMRADFDVDAIFDLELAVEEACSSLLTRATGGSVLICRFALGADDIMVTVTVTSADEAPPSRSTVGWRVLATLADAVTSWTEPGEDTLHRVHIEFVKRRPVT